MPIMTHIGYTYGAFLGTIIGSFIVHFGDTLAARAFSEAKRQGLWATIKILLKSFMPVCIGVAPMRALAFGVYSISQQFFYNSDGFDGRIFGAILCGFILVVLSTPGEILKTHKQIELDNDIPWYKALNCADIRGNFLPLCYRIVPTITCMLAGGEFIRILLGIDNLVISIAIASITAATIAQGLATPFENIRIYRIQHSNYTTSTLEIIKNLKFHRIYKGFWYRGLSLGLQATFTLVAANMLAEYYK